jgi:hypothetical protein
MNWRAKPAGRKLPYYYAACTESAGGERVEYHLHKLVFERMTGHTCPEGFIVDHRNQDKLDNRRANLRLVSKKHNEANKKKRRTQAGKAPSSKYKGVSKIKKKGRVVKNPWRAIITVDKEQISLGHFATEKEAAIAYNDAAVEHFGEFAYINEIEEDK